MSLNFTHNKDWFITNFKVEFLNLFPPPHMGRKQDCQSNYSEMFPTLLPT